MLGREEEPRGELRISRKVRNQNAGEASEATLPRREGKILFLGIWHRAGHWGHSG